MCKHCGMRDGLIPSLPGLHAELVGLGAPRWGCDPRWLLLHGFTGNCEDWRDWPFDRPALAIDLPGHGRSADPCGAFSGEVRRLLDALPPQVDSLAGYSLGGRLVLGLIHAAPERFRRALVISAHWGLASATACSERRAQDRRWARLLREQGIDVFIDAWERQPLFASQGRLPVDVRARQRAVRLGQRPEGLACALDALGLAQMPDTWQALMRWPGELDWVVGGLDQKFVRIGQRVLEQRPATRLHVIPGVGHNPLLEAPGKLFAAVFPS